MFEIEKKYRIPTAERVPLEQRLNEAYGPPERLRESDLHGFTSDQKHYLRLRRSNDAVKLIAKGPTTVSADGIRRRQEIELPIPEDSFDRAQQLVQLLTIEPLPPMHRERLVWKLESGSEAVLDQLDALPEQAFVELEVLGTDADAAQNRLRALEAKLGLDPTWYEVRSYAQILSDTVAGNSQENVTNRG